MLRLCMARWAHQLSIAESLADVRSYLSVGNAAARAAKKQAGKRQLTAANGSSSRKHDSLPIQSPQKGLAGSQDGYRPSYL